MIEPILKYINDRLLVGGRAESVGVDDDLLEEGLIDSMGMMSLIGFIESEFKVQIPPQEMIIENFQTVGAIAKYLKKTGTDHDIETGR